MATIRNFMIIDPSQPVRSNLQRLLESLGYTIVTSLSSNEDALNQMNMRQTQFLIINWNCTPVPGMIFLQKVHQSPRFRYIPTIIIAKQVAGADLRLATELGLKVILPENFDMAAAKKAITGLIEAEEKIHPEMLKVREAAALVEDGKTEQAIPILYASQKIIPDSSELGRLYGEILAAKEDWQTAESVVMPAQTANQRDVSLKQILARVFARTGRQKQALELLQQLSEYSPLNISTLIGLGKAYEDDGQTAKAKETFGKVAQMDASNEEAKSGLGRVAVAEGAYQEALSYFSNPKTNIEVVRIFNNAGVAALHRGERSRAIECYHSAISLLDKNPDIYRVKYNLALALKSDDKLQEALDLLLECITTPIAAKAYSAFRRVAALMNERQISVDQGKLKDAENRMRRSLQQAS